MNDRTVLLVEDDCDLREVIADVLSAAGFRVLQARHGAEALEILRASSDLPAIILLDLMMPVMTGVQFRALQQEDARLSAIPVVVMSAVTDGELKASTLNPAGFLRKPADRQHILAVVQRCCPDAERPHRGPVP